MSRWSELFRKLTQVETPVDTCDTCDTCRETAPLSVDTWNDTCATHETRSKDNQFLSSHVSTSVDPCVTPKNGSFSPSVTSVTCVNRVKARIADADAGSTPDLGIPQVELIYPDLLPPLAPSPILVFCDFETRTTGGCDLAKAGAWRYAADPTTEIICFGYRIAGEDRVWNPEVGLSNSLVSLASDPDARFISFAGFEAAVWQIIMVERFGFPPISAERWIDVRATCSYLALPRKLEKVLPVLGLPIVKDSAGQRLVRSLSKPNKQGIYPEITPEILQRICDYNRSDVDAVEKLHTAVGTLPEGERRVWELDQKINARGVGIDIEFVLAAKRIADQSIGEVLEEFDALTGGLSPHQVTKTRDWWPGMDWLCPICRARQ
jgi:hypothetical protein